MTFFNSYQKLQKSRYKTQTSNKKKEELFVDKLGKLFDVAAQNALSLMSNKDVREFLLMQRNDPTCCSTAGRDMPLAAFEDRKRKRNEIKKKQENREKDRTNCVQTAEFEDYCSNDSQDELSSEECSSETPCPSKKCSRKKKKLKQIVASEVATVLDRVNVSERKATMVIATVTKHLGNELEEVTFSRCTVRRARKSNRQNYALQKGNDFVPTAPLLCIGMGKCFPA